MLELMKFRTKHHIRPLQLDIHFKPQEYEIYPVSMDLHDDFIDLILLFVHVDVKVRCQDH